MSVLKDKIYFKSDKDLYTLTWESIGVNKAK